jgi:hypothetical protein
MRVVGSRREPEMVKNASGTLLAQSARFNESIARLAQVTLVRKGVYRFRSHQDANQHDMNCIALGMARVALGRR